MNNVMVQIVMVASEECGMPGLRLADFIAGASGDRYIDNSKQLDYYGAIRQKLINKNAKGRSEWSVSRHSASSQGMIALPDMHLILIQRQRVNGWLNQFNTTS